MKKDINKTTNSAFTYAERFSADLGLVDPTCFQHITIHTGHTCTQPVDTQDKEVTETLSQVIEDALTKNGWTDLKRFGEDCRLHISVADCALLAKLYLPSSCPQPSNPVLQIGISAKAATGVDIWRHLHSHAITVAPGVPPSPPAMPWIGAIFDKSIEHSLTDKRQALAFTSMMTWVGDFEGCLAWGFVHWLQSRSGATGVIGGSCASGATTPTPTPTPAPAPAPAPAPCKSYETEINVDHEAPIHIVNQGQRILHTNYFDSALAACGLIYLSWNAGAGRLLLPDNEKGTLRDMRSAKFVIVSSGPWVEHGGVSALELLFEDHSDAPFVITIPSKHSDRTLPETDQGGDFYISVWTRGGQKLRLPARYRKVASLPCMAEWQRR